MIMTAQAWLVAVVGVCCFASFSWAVAAHFRREDATPTGMRLISAASVLGFCWFIGRLLAAPPSRLWSLALVMFGAAFLLFWWTIGATRSRRPALAFSDAQPRSLLQRGPYRYVRHPFYFCYILFWAGTSVATPGITHWVVPVAMLCFYAVAARGEERSFAASSLGPDYMAYRNRTGMLFPLPAFRSRPSLNRSETTSGRV